LHILEVVAFVTRLHNGIKERTKGIIALGIACDGTDCLDHGMAAVVHASLYTSGQSDTKISP